MVSIVDKWHVLIRGRHEVLDSQVFHSFGALCASVFTLSVSISAISDDYGTARYTIPVYEILLLESCNICMPNFPRRRRAAVQESGLEEGAT